MKKELDTEKLVIDKDALEKLGLIDTPIYLIEYDLPKESERFTKKMNRLLRQLRNKLNFALKFKILAMRNLDSSWIIPEERLAYAKEFIHQLKNEYKTKGFQGNIDRRIRIIPILTTKQEEETYADRMVNFLTEWITEAQETIIKGIKSKTLSEAGFWRVKKCFEDVHTHLTHPMVKRHKLVNQIRDDLQILDMDIHRYECIVEEKRKKERAENGKEEDES